MQLRETVRGEADDPTSSSAKLWLRHAPLLVAPKSVSTVDVARSAPTMLRRRRTRAAGVASTGGEGAKPAGTSATPLNPASPLSRRKYAASLPRKKLNLRRVIMFWIRVLVLGRVAASQVGLLLLCIIGSSCASITSPIIVRRIIDDIVPSGSTWRLHGAIACLFTAGCIRVVCRWGERAYSARVATRVSASLQRQMFQRLQHVSMRFFHNTQYSEVGHVALLFMTSIALLVGNRDGGVGVQVSLRMRADVNQAHKFFSSTAVELLADLVMLVVSTAFLATIHWRPVVAIAVLFPVFVIPAQRIRKSLIAQYRQSHGQMGRVAQVMHETLEQDGALITRTAGGQDINLGKFESARQVYNATAERMGSVHGVLVGIHVGFWIVAYCLTYWIGGYVWSIALPSGTGFVSCCDAFGSAGTWR